MPPDDHENRISRLEFRMEMVSEQQHRADEERREHYVCKKLNKHDDGHC